MPPTRYTGRFAPSPTGPLHFGSLVAALGSYLEARRQGGRWLLRMEDLDPPRELPGAADAILRLLEAYGFQWDGPVMYQSRRGPAYEAALEQLAATGASYPCDCSRATVATNALPGRPQVYAGSCRVRHEPLRGPHALRVRTDGAVLVFEDRLQGRQEQALETEVGDFVVRRADGLYAYQLAVVVDDAGQGVTEVVRGSDLLDSTPRQIHLQTLLGLPTPSYLHLPVALNGRGEKWSKQTHAPALDPGQPLPALWQAAAFLGQDPPTELRHTTRDEFWRWALTHWTPATLPRSIGLPWPQEPPRA